MKGIWGSDMKNISLESVLIHTFLQFVAGILTGIVLALIAGAGGYFLFGTGIPLVIALLKIVPVTVGLVAGIFTVISYVSACKSKENIPHLWEVWLGENPVKITDDVTQGLDGKHRLRMTRSDGPEHYHMEVLNPETQIVLENNVCGGLKTNDRSNNTLGLWAKVDERNNGLFVVHYLGFPPEVTEGEDRRTALPFARLLLIEQRENDIFLFRFTKEGDYAGDTWHQSVEEAKKQAKFEYNVSVDSWQKIPSDVKNVGLYLQNRF